MKISEVVLSATLTMRQPITSIPCLTFWLFESLVLETRLFMELPVVLT